MNTTKFDTIIFDLGGVLIDWNPEYVFRTMFDDETEMRYFLTEVCNHDWNIQQDAGRPWAEATDLLIAQHPQYESHIRAYHGRWREMLSGAIPGTVEILEALHRRKQHRLVALTNWSNETFPVAQEMFPFLQLFEGILVSGAEKLIKPDPRIYQLILERFSIHPNRALFIDDNHKNVEGAKAVGIEAVRFESPEQLRRYLVDIGVL
jgi:2-haloacid dehalogenase